MNGNSELPKLGVNIDHIATLRQLRKTPYPDLLEAARCAERAGAHQITVHLREDARHIQPEDVKNLKANIGVSLNLEMAVTEEMAGFATRVKPNWVCLVPEKRQELTTEGGLNLAKIKKKASKAIAKLVKSGIRVSCFIEPSPVSVKISREIGANAVEFHTGRYCLATQNGFGKKSEKIRLDELKRLKDCAELTRSLGLGCHAGHGFDFENVRAVAQWDLIEEFNIGHSIVCRAAIVGLERAVREMLSSIHAP